jgi:DNA-binding response OmpR family regulator
MSQAIDVLIIDPLDSDARKTIAAVRRKAPHASTLRVIGADQAARLMFERGLFTKSPQMPRLIIVDVAASGESGKEILRRVRDYAHSEYIPIVVFSARRDQKDILECHLLGAHMNIVKPVDPNDYASVVERVVATWLSGGFLLRAQEAS